MSEGCVRQWCHMFKNGRTNVRDEERSGRQSIVNADLIPLVDERVLKLLSEEQKAQRMGAALSFLQRYEREGDTFLDQIVTGNETWLRYVNAERKLQSMEWGHTQSPKKPTKLEFLERNATINSERYCNTLTNLKRAIQNKRRGMLSSGVIFLHDNARPHTARHIATKLQEFNWEVLDHRPYSPDLAHSDYHLFMHMKTWLSTKRFDDDEELKTSVVSWLQSQAAEFYDCGISKLVKRYDKCLNKLNIPQKHPKLAWVSHGSRKPRFHVLVSLRVSLMASKLGSLMGTPMASMLATMPVTVHTKLALVTVQIGKSSAISYVAKTYDQREAKPIRDHDKDLEMDHNKNHDMSHDKYHDVDNDKYHDMDHDKDNDKDDKEKDEDH
ncbi:hypothetical protein ANN_23723 [Periplaneta americana]|uniref:Histone-lysine N-methyltransferase SETMAR n=1 Tax=Periplaneta americana TaxID=6978 RepID=A0ABQ8SLX1_PERAM|nr:hypothetical protein ANN_23723 [Periplaneta americana]